jgi:hypothetical protein
MGEYSAKIDFQTIVACKEALEVYKAVLKAQSKSDYELKENIEYKKICDAYDKICSKL